MEMSPQSLGATPHHSDRASTLDLEDALTPDPGTEDMFLVQDNKFAYSPGQLSKLLSPKSLAAFYALGGLSGIEKGLRTNHQTGLSIDEGPLDGSLTFYDVATPGAPPYGALGHRDPELKDDSHSRGKKSHKTTGKEAGSNHDDGQIIRSRTGMSTHAQQGTRSKLFADRRRIFGTNKLPEKKSKSIPELAWIAYNDKVLILLTVVAAVSLALGLYQAFGVNQEPGEAQVEWVEGIAIIVAIVIVIAVSTINDWQMERQFNRLNKKHADRTVKIIRSGRSSEISVFDVLVGDVLHLSTGDIVPVDGIFVNGYGVKCDESSATGESDLLKKVPAETVWTALQELHALGDRANEEAVKRVEKLDPFIISGSKVNEGTGTFLVTAVGENSSYGRITMAMHTENEDTPLQQKLNGLADGIAKFGVGSALLLFLVLFIKFLARLPHNSASLEAKGQEFLELFIVSLTVVVVAVPEGLPLAVTLALAFATSRMTKDNNLVRVLKACETMGNATTICCDKTGTLTQNKMTVVAVAFGGGKSVISFGGAGIGKPLDAAKANDASESQKTTGPSPTVNVADFSQSLSREVKQLLFQGNAVNSTAFEGDRDGEKTFIGSKTEVALLTFCRDHLGAPPVQEERSNADVVQVVPFDSVSKFMATVVRLPSGKYRAYVKGASEILLGQCTRMLTEPGDGASSLTTTPLAGIDRDRLSETIESYAAQTLRTIGSSYRDFDDDVWPPSYAASPEDPARADFTKLHEDMTLIAIFGIKDPLRPSVPKAIQDCQCAGIVVRMVTGDNLLTARAIAAECGIYDEAAGGLALEGPAFRRKSEAELREIVPRLQVLARSSPEDKRILVRTLKDLGETVAVTGDGTNDAPALKMADIGFAMGIAGTDVAKEAASIILMDDNFTSIVKGCMWGRAVNDSVKKFLQFQLTVNVTAVLLTFVSSVASAEEESVLNAVQLLWVNLIMDTFAALVLATDPPSRSVLDRKPERKSASLITLRMAKMILGQAICQLVITLVLYFAGWNSLGYNDVPDAVEANLRLKTLVFNTFVWLQIFNEINNRRLDNKLNILEGIHRNKFFLLINLLMVGGQVLIIFVGGEAFQIARLNGWEWGLSIGLGAISIPCGMAIRCIPDAWVASLLPWFIRERWAPETISPRDWQLHRTDTDGLRPPLRVMSMVRGARAKIHSRRSHLGVRQYVREQKVRVKNAAGRWSPSADRGGRVHIGSGSMVA